MLSGRDNLSDVAAGLARIPTTKDVVNYSPEAGRCASQMRDIEESVSTKLPMAVAWDQHHDAF